MLYDLRDQAYASIGYTLGTLGELVGDVRLTEQRTTEVWRYCVLQASLDLCFLGCQFALAPRACGCS